MPKTWMPSEILRQRIRQSGRTYREMSDATGLHLPTLWRFLNGRGGLQLSTVDRLFELFGLRVVEAPPRKHPQSKRKGD